MSGDIIERLIAARDNLKGLNISDCALIREAREAMAEAANALASVSAERDEARAQHTDAAVAAMWRGESADTLRTRAERAEFLLALMAAAAERSTLVAASLAEDCGSLRACLSAAESEAASWKADAASYFLALGEAREVIRPFARLGELLDRYEEHKGSPISVNDYGKHARAAQSWLSKHGSKDQ